MGIINNEDIILKLDILTYKKFVKYMNNVDDKCRYSLSDIRDGKKDTDMIYFMAFKDDYKSFMSYIKIKDRDQKINELLK